ncbi:MAG: homoserine kinase [Prochlorothrix sp.]
MTLTVTVPATTANLGPGFDCLGAALTLHNRFIFSRLAAGAPQPQLELRRADRQPKAGNSNSRDSNGSVAQAGTSQSHGANAITPDEPESLVLDSDNLLWRAVLRFYEAIGQDPTPMRITIEMGVPLARGLGSSATAIVGGLVGANALEGYPLTLDQLGALATELEGHPDNVIPALLGGCRLAACGAATDAVTGLEGADVGDGASPVLQLCEIPWSAEFVPVVAIPDFELSTEAARQVLPATYSRADAVFNAAHVGLLLQALATGNGDWLRSALQDRIHQPYRQSLIPGFGAVQRAAVEAGAYGLVISGAGPTLLAIAPVPVATAVATAMATAWTTDQPSVQVKTLVLAIDRQGAQVCQESHDNG